MKEICWQIIVAAFMQPLQYDLRSPAAKDNSITVPMQPQQKATLTQPFTLRERSYSCKAQWNSIGNSSTSTTCNPIYIAGTILQLQITMEQLQKTIVLPMQPQQKATLTQPFTLRERSYSCKAQ